MDFLAMLLLAGGLLVFVLGLTLRVAIGAWRPAGLVRRPPDPRERALEVLSERYVLGEIDRDEYLERRAFIE